MPPLLIEQQGHKDHKDRILTLGRLDFSDDFQTRRNIFFTEGNEGNEGVPPLFDFIHQHSTFVAFVALL